MKDKLFDEDERIMEEDIEFGDTDECVISDQNMKQ
jgi:hypothetical protein